MVDSLARRPAFLLLLAFIGGLIVLRWRGCLEPRGDGPLAAWVGRPEVRFEARVVSPLKLELQGSKVVVKTPQGELVETFFPRSWPGNRVPLTGQSGFFAGKLRRPRPARNPGEFDERVFLADRGVGWVLQARRVELDARPLPWRWLFASRAEQLRRSIEAVFAANLPDAAQARLLDGVMLGDKGPLPRDINAAVQDAGVMHLLVPSGAKVGLVFLAAAGWGWLLGLSPWARWALAAALGGGYTVMVGGEPPYARAYWCALALGAGLASGRECAPFDALVLSAWAVLLCAPRDLFSLGFQMTYAAAFGLCLLLPRLRAQVPDSWPRLARWTIEALLASAVVQALLAPMLATAFGRVSLIAVVANVLLVPLATMIAAGGLLLWASVWAGLAHATAALRWTDVHLLALFVGGCRFFAACPFAAMAAAPWSDAATAAYYLGLLAPLAWPRRVLCASISVVSLVVAAAPIVWARCRAPSAQALYLALPRGEAAFVTIAGRERWLIEGGAPAEPILRALKAEGLPRVDHLVADGSAGSDRALPKLKAYAPQAPVERKKAFSWREKNVVFEFWPPRLRCGPDEFSIISLHRRAAITASTDGITLQIR